MSDEVTPQTSIGFGHGAYGRGPYVAQVLTAALALAQANETLSGAGSVLSAVSGALNLTQAPQTLAAVGHVAVAGTLVATQAPQTLAGTGYVIPGAFAALGLTQDAQSLVAAGKTDVLGTLGAVQDDQGLDAIARNDWPAWVGCEAGEWPAAPSCETGSWWPIPEPVATVGFGRYGYGAGAFGLTRAAKNDYGTVGFGRYGFGAGPFGSIDAAPGNSIIGTWPPANDCGSAAWQPARIGRPGTWSKAA